MEDDDAVAILGAVAAAGATHEATVLVLEAVLPDAPDFHRAKTLDVMMLALTGGRDRPRPDVYSALDCPSLGVLIDAVSAAPAGVEPA